MKRTSQDHVVDQNLPGARIHRRRRNQNPNLNLNLNLNPNQNQNQNQNHEWPLVVFATEIDPEAMVPIQTRAQLEARMPQMLSPKTRMPLVLSPKTRNRLHQIEDQTFIENDGIHGGPIKGPVSIVPQIDPRQYVKDKSPMRIIDVAHSEKMLKGRSVMGLTGEDLGFLDAMIVLSHFPLYLYEGINREDPMRLHFDSQNVMLFWMLNAIGSDSGYLFKVMNTQLGPQDLQTISKITEGENFVFLLAQNAIRSGKETLIHGLEAGRYDIYRIPIVRNRVCEFDNHLIFSPPSLLLDSDLDMLRRIFDQTKNPILVNWMYEQLQLYCSPNQPIASKAHWKPIFDTKVNTPDLKRGRGIATDALVVMIERKKSVDYVLFEHAIVSPMLQDQSRYGIRIQAIGANRTLGAAIRVTQRRGSDQSKDSFDFEDSAEMAHPPHAIAPDWITAGRGVFGVRIFTPNVLGDGPSWRFPQEYFDEIEQIEYDVNHYGYNGREWTNTTFDYPEYDLSSGQAIRATVTMLLIGNNEIGFTAENWEEILFLKDADLNGTKRAPFLRTMPMEMKDPRESDLDALQDLDLDLEA